MFQGPPEETWSGRGGRGAGWACTPAGPWCPGAAAGGVAPGSSALLPHLRLLDVCGSPPEMQEMLQEMQEMLKEMQVERQPPGAAPGGRPPRPRP